MLTPDEEQTLRSLIEKARGTKMSPEEYAAHRRSFVFGNVAISNPNITFEVLQSAERRCCERHRSEDSPIVRSFMICCPSCHEKNCPRALDCSKKCGVPHE